jgi:hypothetical protein
MSDSAMVHGYGFGTIVTKYAVSRCPQAGGAAAEVTVGTRYGLSANCTPRSFVCRFRPKRIEGIGSLNFGDQIPLRDVD